MVEATGHGWDHWFAALDEWGARERKHADIARWLRDDAGVPGWYSQAIAVTYERARGLRAVGEGVNGFAVSASRTIAVPAEVLFAAFDDPARVSAGSRAWSCRCGPPRRRGWPGTTGRAAPRAWWSGIEALEDGRSRVGLSARAAGRQRRARAAEALVA